MEGFFQEKKIGIYDKLPQIEMIVVKIIKNDEKGPHVLV